MMTLYQIVRSKVKKETPTNYTQVHEDALNDYDLWSRLQCQSEDCKFDLIITSPLFNEIGVMLGKTLNFQTLISKANIFKAITFPFQQFCFFP